MTVLEGISSLRSVRKFKPDPVAEDKIRIVLESASKAASGSKYSAMGICGGSRYEGESSSQEAYVENMA